MVLPRNTSRRTVTDENAENNTAITRLTRAKAAALETTTTAGDPPKKTLAVKKTTLPSTTTTALGPRKRAALGDLSNVAKNENVDNSDAKKLGAKPALSKISKPAGIVKHTARPLSSKPLNVQKPAAGDLKRPASGSGVGGPTLKKRNTSDSRRDAAEYESSNNNNDDTEATENIPPLQNGAHLIKKSNKTAAAAAPIEVLADPDADLDHKTLEELSWEAKDLDAEDEDDPLMVAEYVHEIFDYMKELEIATMPAADYMDNQEELEWKMRGILVDWLLEVHTRFRLLPETLFLAVNIIDRFLSVKVVQLDRLQLVGVTAMFIASKYEEVLSPHVQNFKHVADDGFSESEILTAERYLLSSLNYDLSYPNPMNFLRRISKADNYDIQTRTLGKYLLEIGCLDHRFLQYPPSRVAAASMYLARLALEKGEWDATLAVYSGYTEQDIMPVFKLMVDYLHGPVVHEAFFRKYASKKFMKASIVLRQWAKKWAPVYLDGAAATATTTTQPGSGKTSAS